MIFERIKAIKPQKFDVKNGDDAYAEYIGKLPMHAHAGNLFAIIGTVAAAVTVVVGVSLWAIIGSGVRGKPQDDPVVIAPSDEGNDTKNDKTPSVDTEPEVADPVPDNNDKSQTGTKSPQENESDPIKPQESQTNNTKPPVTTPTKQDKSFILGDADIDNIGFKAAYKEKPVICADIPIFNTVLLHNTEKKITLSDSLKDEIKDKLLKKHYLLDMPYFEITEIPTVRGMLAYFEKIGLDVTTPEQANKYALDYFGYADAVTALEEYYPKSYDYNSVKVVSLTQYKTKDGRDCFTLVTSQRVQPGEDAYYIYSTSFIGKSYLEPDIFFENSIKMSYPDEINTRKIFTPILVDMTVLTAVESMDDIDVMYHYNTFDVMVNKAIKNGGAFVRFIKAGDSVGYYNGYGIIDIFDTPIKITEVYCGSLKKGDIVSFFKTGNVIGESEFGVYSVNYTSRNDPLQDGVEYIGLLCYNDDYSEDGFVTFNCDRYVEVIKNSDGTESLGNIDPKLETYYNTIFK